MSVNDAPFLGIAPEHLPAFIAVLLAAPGLWLFMKGTRRLCGKGFMPAVRFVSSYHAAPLVVRLVAVLLVVTGVAHLALAFDGHAGEMGGLFLLDGLAYLVLAWAAIRTRRWRPLAAMLLALNLLAYTVVIGQRQESFEHFGMAIKLAELTALGLVLSPRGLAVRRRWLAWAAMVAPFFSLGILVGGVTWVTSITHAEAAGGEEHVHADGSRHRHGHTHDARDALAGRGTALDPAYAAWLAAETKARVARFEDIEVARAEGYRANFSQESDTPHFEHPRYMKDRTVLDPSRPEQLVYVRTPSGPKLAGVVYVMPRAGERGPAIGAGAHWHTHTLCVTPLPMFITGIMPPTGLCPPGSVNFVTPEMIHVWTVDNPGGPFAEELDKDYLRELMGR
jgi:hypothetical protein